MTRFTVKTTDTPLGAVASAYEKRCSTATVGTATTLTATVPAGQSGTGAELHSAWSDTEQPHNAADWPTSGWGVSADVTSAGADVTYHVGVSRASSDGATGREVTSIGFDFQRLLVNQSGTGIKTVTAQSVSDINVDASRAETDRVWWRTQATNSNMMVAQSLAIVVEDADTWIENTNFSPPSSGTPANTVTETDSPIALGKKKVRAAGTNLETDAAQVLARSKRRALGINTEAGAAQALGRRKVRVLGTATETDSAVAITTAGQSAAVGTVTETDTAVALGRTKRKSIGVATETDTAIALGKIDPIRASVSPALETDATVSVGRAKRKVISSAVETDAAITPGKAKRKALPLVLETDTAVRLGDARAISPALETDTAQAVGRRKARAVGTALETDASQLLSRIKAKALGVTAETDLAIHLGSSYFIGVGTVTETDTAQVVGRVKRKAVGTALETEAVVALGKRKTRAVVLTTETDAAQSLGRRKSRAIGVTTTTDGLLAFGRRKSRTIGIPTEADAARPITVTTPFLGIAQESDLAMPIGRRKTRALPIVTNTVVAYGDGTYGGGPYGGGGDVAMPIRPAHSRMLSIALETDVALAPTHAKRRSVSWAQTLDEARPLGIVVPMYRFEPPTYQRIINPPPLTRRVARPIQLDESSSVVRVGGSFTLVKIPTPEQLEAAGVEGEDYFIGGHVYTIPHGLAAELQAAGYSSTEI